MSDPQLLTLIRAIHAEIKGAYGSPRMLREIRGRGFPASKARIERLMRENGISGPIFRVSSCEPESVLPLKQILTGPTGSWATGFVHGEEVLP